MTSFTIPTIPAISTTIPALPAIASTVESTRSSALLTATTIGSGVVGGVFFAFSTFVMPALDKLTPSQSIAAMQAINKAAPNPLFMAALFGTAIACVAVGISAINRWGAAGTRLQLGAAALYLVAIVLTIAYHVPHNDALAKVDPNVLDAARRWATYSRGWTMLNHVRTVTPIAAAAMLVLSRRAVR